MLYIFNERLVVSILYSKCDNNNDRIFKQKCIEILKILGLIVNINE